MSKSSNHLNAFEKDRFDLERLIRIKEVCKLTGLSRSYIYQLTERGFFPKKVQLVPGGTAVAWVEREIEDYINQQIKARG